MKQTHLIKITIFAADANMGCNDCSLHLLDKVGESDGDSLSSNAVYKQEERGAGLVSMQTAYFSAIFVLLLGLLGILHMFQKNQKKLPPRNHGPVGEKTGESHVSFGSKNRQSTYSSSPNLSGLLRHED